MPTTTHLQRQECPVVPIYSDTFNSCALQPISGKLYQYFSLKWTYIFFLGFFELGSLICATAVSSVMLIVGRAVAGMGAAGLFSGALVILSRSIALRQRPSMCCVSYPMLPANHLHSLYRSHHINVWNLQRRWSNPRRCIYPTCNMAMV